MTDRVTAIRSSAGAINSRHTSPKWLLPGCGTDGRNWCHESPGTRCHTRSSTASPYHSSQSQTCTLRSETCCTLQVKSRSRPCRSDPLHPHRSHTWHLRSIRSLLSSSPSRIRILMLKDILPGYIIESILLKKCLFRLSIQT